MSDDTPPVEPDESEPDADDTVPILEEGMETIDLADTIEVEVVDPLEEATLRAEKAEKEIAYKDAEFVSDANSLALLWRLGVDYAQGYYIHEPSEALDYNFEDDD